MANPALLTWWLSIGFGSLEEEDGSGLLNDDFAHDPSLLLYPEKAGKTSLKIGCVEGGVD